MSFNYRSIKLFAVAAALLLLAASLFVVLRRPAHLGTKLSIASSKLRNDAAGSHQPADVTQVGMKNAARLLPVARTLTLQALSNLAGNYPVSSEALKRAESNVSAVTQAVLVDDLGPYAEVDDEVPSDIRIGPEYARDLVSDDETLMLLSHELTHVAARDGDLDGLINKVAETAEDKSGVQPTEDQQEDLLCDFVGEQTLKSFVSQNPNSEQGAKRVATVLGWGTDFSLDWGPDDEHLSERDTLKAILGLDPDLNRQLSR